MGEREDGGVGVRVSVDARDLDNVADSVAVKVMRGLEVCICVTEGSAVQLELAERDGVAEALAD